MLRTVTPDATRPLRVEFSRPRTCANPRDQDIERTGFVKMDVPPHPYDGVDPIIWGRNVRDRVIVHKPAARGRCEVAEHAHEICRMTAADVTRAKNVAAVYEYRGTPRYSGRWRQTMGSELCKVIVVRDYNSTTKF